MFNPRVTFTCLTSTGLLTKTIRPDSNGGIIREPAAQMTSGVAETVTLYFAEFGPFLRTLQRNQAIAHGATGFDRINIVSTSLFADQPKTITRTKDFFKYPDSWGLGMFDHDLKPGQAPLTKVQLLDAVANVWPEFRTLPKWWTPSTSSCIYDSIGNQLTGEGNGVHLYFPFAPASMLPDLAKVLFKRLWLAGHGFIFVTRAGTMLPRTIFDLTVFSPERLDFVAGANCIDCEQRLPQPEYFEGEARDGMVTLPPSLTPTQERLYDALVAEAKERALPEADRIKTVRIEMEVAEMCTSRDIPREQAEKIVSSRHDGKLQPDDIIRFQGGDIATVGEIIADPIKYQGRPCSDPLEPEEGTSRAKLYVNANSIVLHTMLHGGASYVLQTTLSDFAEDISKETKDLDYDEEILAGLLKMVTADCGAVHLPDVVGVLARLKHRDKARFVRLRDDLKKIKGVLLTEFDKDILQFLRTKSQKEPSFPSSSSFSNSYTSLSLSLEEENPHLQVCFIRRGASGRDALCQQSEAALVLAEHLRGQFTYDSDACTWLQFVGTHWEAANQTLVERRVQALLYAGTSGHGFTHNYQRGVMAILQRMSELALGLRPIGLIPFANGLLDMKTKVLLPTTPEMALTWCLPFDHDQSALCQKFQNWLANAVDGDKDTVRLIRAFINAVLVGRPDLQRFLHLCGPGGTGKSTLERLILAMVGPNNATTSTLRLLEENRFETAGLYEKRLVCIDEADKYGGAVSVFKKMTGQDPLRMERKNQQQGGSFIFKGQVLITSNERFSTKDLTSGIERRRVTVEFTRRITEQERVEWDRLGGEEGVLHNEIPGIINWALELSRNEVTSVFKVLPERVRMANIDAAMFNNPVLEWMLVVCVPDCFAKGKVGDKRQISDGNGGKTYAHAGEWLYPTYVLWCQQSERKNVSLQKFSQTLVEAAAQFGVKAVRKTSSAGAHIEGLRLRREDERMWLENVTHDHCNPMRDSEGKHEDCNEVSTSRYYEINKRNEGGEVHFDIGQYIEKNEGAASLSTDEEIVEEEI